MIGKAHVIDANLLIKWLQVMVEGMEKHRGDEYFEGAAKSYSATIAVVQSGMLDIQH